ncbi:hypothetical protein GDO81_012308, partial [Engystomops pustulosus]
VYVSSEGGREVVERGDSGAASWPRPPPNKMDGDTSYNKVEVVYVSYVEDAVTFWGQSMKKINDISEISESLAKFCPTMSTVFGTPDMHKVYGGMFSADKCWYRCKLLHVVNDEQCAVTYIDYGNTEILERSSIVELPEELQCPPIAQKYRLWGLQLQVSSDVEQGLKFLTQLIADKKVSVLQKAIYKDGTVVVQVSHEDLDIGEEVAKKGFAVRSRLNNSSPNGALESGDSPAPDRKPQFPWQVRNLERLPMREPKSLPMFSPSNSNSNRESTGKNGFRALRSPSNDINDVRSDQKFLEENKQLKDETKQLAEEVAQLKESNKQLKDENLQIMAEKKELLEESKKLKEEKEILSQKSIALDLQMQKMQLEIKNEKEIFERNINEMEIRLASAAGNKLKALAAKIDILKSMLLNSLQEVYGASCDGEDSADSVDSAFQEFYQWKQAKLEKFNTIRSDTDSSLGLLCTWLSNIEKFFDLRSNISLGSCDVVLDIDSILEKVDCCVSKELEISLVEPDEEDRKIIANAYSRVVKLIFEETRLISALQAKYLSSVEFKKNMSEWINKNPNVDDLITIKKTLKGYKADLRWKLHVSSTMEESDEYNAKAHGEVKDEIATVRSKIFQEIQREQEEYALLSTLVQKWFPELPLLYSDVGITSYMSSGGLLSGSMERVLFDAEPLKELSNKRPLVHTQVQGHKVLLKGYSVGVDTEEQVIIRASKYHNAWAQQKEESGIMQLLYLFFCKHDPMVYLMVPFYPGESLACIQANEKLSPYETMRVMRGVAQGLHTLHASDIIIGSLHENNVFAVNRDRGIVGDFDFTRDAEQRSSATSICFPLLTAPEVKLGQPASASSDVYAYGILLLWKTKIFYTNPTELLI